MKKPNILGVLQATVLISVLLYFGKTLFIPLSFSTLISLILYPGCRWMEKKGLNRSVATAISIASITIVLSAILYLLIVQLLEFSHEWDSIRSGISGAAVNLSAFASERFGISAAKQTALLNSIIGNSGSQIVSLIHRTAFSLSDSFFSLVMISIFSGLQLYHRRMLVNVLYQLFSSEKRETIQGILSGTIHAFFNFIKGMALVYLIVGILNSLGLAIIGISHPVLFGFIASILTFVPYVGILVASLLPIAASWIEFNSIWYPMAVVLVFAVVQLLEAYIIFPFAVGNQLRINTLAIIILIIVGGILWGAAGMILFIPFASILKLVADRTKGLEILSVVLGDGKTK